MRAVLQRIPSTHLATLVAVADATIWLAGFPFELYCKGLLAEHRAHLGFLLLILLVNALFVAMIVAATFATGELVRRGLSRPVRVPLRVLPENPSKRSGY